MKTIFETFKKSIYSPAFYQNVGAETLSEGVRYYIKFSLFLSLIMTAALGVLLVPQGVSFVKDRAPEMVKNYFPTDLTITIEKGMASVNVDEPFIIPGKDASKSMLKEQGLENMLVIDTKHDFDIKKFEEYKTYALLTKTEVVTQSGWGQITIKELSTFPNSVINQAWILSLVEKVRSSMGYIVFGGLVGTFVAVMLGYLMYFVVLLIFAFVPLSIAYIKKSSMSYGSAYKMSLYAVTPALALKTLVNILGVFFVPAYFTFLVFVLIISLNMRDTEEPTLFKNN